MDIGTDLNFASLIKVAFMESLCMCAPLLACLKKLFLSQPKIFFQSGDIFRMDTNFDDPIAVDTF